MRVIITAEAENDLRSIAGHVAEDSPADALKLVAELRAACEGLADFPGRFPVAPGFESLGVRRRLVGNYLIFYRIDTDRVVVIHILHGARDYMELFDSPS
jgi:plasmid stabilization system protein ParE